MLVALGADSMSSRLTGNHITNKRLVGVMAPNIAGAGPREPGNFVAGTVARAGDRLAPGWRPRRSPISDAATRPSRKRTGPT